MIDVISYNGEGYAKQIGFQTWKVALIRYAERFDAKNIKRLERHLLTDEVFVLLEGTALLYTESDEIPMEKGKLYNVRQGSWHAISCSEDGLVLIVENDDTGLQNTEYVPRTAAEAR